MRAGVRLVGKGQAVQRSWHPDRDAACHGRNLAHVEGAGDSAGARGRQHRNSDVENLLRYAVVLVVFAVLMLTHFADPLAAFAGLMGMKASAYLAAFYTQIQRKEEEVRR